MNLDEISKLAAVTHERVKELREIIRQEDFTKFTREMFENLGEYLLQLYSIFLLLVDLHAEIRHRK